MAVKGAQAPNANNGLDANQQQISKDLDTDIDKSLLFQREMLRLQTKAQTNSQEISARSAIEKAKHEALMNIANNIK